MLKHAEDLAQEEINQSITPLGKIRLGVTEVIGMGLATFETSVGVCWCVTAFVFVVLMLLATMA